MTLVPPTARLACLLLAGAFLSGFGGDVGSSSASRGFAAVVPGSVVEIKGSSREWRGLLVEAVQTEGTTVRLGPDVDMDMSGLGPIFVARGVTLTSVRAFAEPEGKGSGSPGRKQPAQARSAQALGPVLFTKTRPKPLFQVECFPDGAINDDVRFSGFRLHGPDVGTASGDDHLQIGIQIVNCVGIEISNMELKGWSGQAIRIVDDSRFPGVVGRINRPEQVRIHDNFIHHNQHVGEEGYGVDVSLGAFALIERNVFDFNRHAIQGSGKADGYTAQRNLVLKGGGYHRLGFHTHQFDVHGDNNCGISGLINDSSWNCGRAGGQIVYRENAFQYRRDNAIKIRGTPQFGATIERNIFAHAKVDDAVGLTRGKTRITFGDGPSANVAGVDPFGKYGVCDFDGDGRDDLFLATGVTWWYSSGGELHWSYLNAATEQLDQIRLGYFDGDLRCDVLTASGDQWKISSGGTAAWRHLGAFAAPLSEVAFGQFGNVRDHRAGLTRATTHAFRRAPNGQWFVTALSGPNWYPAQSSSIPMNKLRFGDFTGDGITDVLAVQGGSWSISASATGPWETLNPKLSQAVEGLLIADVDNDNRDDLLRLSGGWPGNQGGWEVSWGGRTDWARLKTLTGLELSDNTIYPHAGRFDGAPGADLLVVDGTRIGLFYSKATGLWRSAYAY